MKKEKKNIGYTKQEKKEIYNNIIGYARVSTIDKQDTTNQTRAIESFIVENKIGTLSDMITESVSSGKKERKIFELVDSLTKDDVLIVYENSRLARNTYELLGMLETIKKVGATLYIISNSNQAVINKGRLDMNTESYLTLQGLFAKIEKEMIRARVRNALRQKKVYGTNTGKPLGKPQTKDVNIKQVNKMRLDGFSWYEITQKTGVSRALYYYHVNKIAINEKKALIRENK